jgi:oligosaccharide repeat unit polymerase
MSELPETFKYNGSQPAQSSVAAAALLPPLEDKKEGHRVIKGVLRGRRDLPMFCNPVVLFLFNWVIMLGALGIHVTYVTYPNMGLPILLFALSLGSFALGYVVAKTTFHHWVTGNESLSYTLDITWLWRLNLSFCCAALLIILFNWAVFGPPPALGIPSSYLIYGRFKQVLFPLLVSITVNATLDSSRWRRVVFALFGIAGLALYVTRGLLMVALLQMFYLFALRTHLNKRKLYTIAAGCLVVAIVAITLIGNVRTGESNFLEYLKIRPGFFGWPMVCLWIIAYVSIPFSNLCWIFVKGNFHGPTFSFLYPLLPSFLTPPNPHAAIHGNPNIIDGASTYLLNYALDFSYVGVFLANLALGLGCGWLVQRSLPRQMLIACIFLTCLSFIFFTDMFIPLSTILQVTIQSLVQKKCFHWGRSDANDLDWATK